MVLDTAKTPAGKLPNGWELKVNAGKPDAAIADDSGAPVLHLKSVKSSFALERPVDVDPSKMPYLAWRWKVTQLPAGGDFRHFTKDDQAAQVMIAFDDRRVLSYIWDTTAPQGTTQSQTALPLVHIFVIVCRSGATDENRWLGETHNVAADYLKAYGKPAPHVKGLRLQINSQHTGTSAESYFTDVEFHSTPQ